MTDTQRKFFVVKQGGNIIAGAKTAQGDELRHINIAAAPPEAVFIQTVTYQQQGMCANWGITTITEINRSGCEVIEVAESELPQPVIASLNLYLTHASAPKRQGLGLF
jgi:hypothetical protein